MEQFNKDLKSLGTTLQPINRH